MKESIYISNFKDNIDTIKSYISGVTQNAKFNFSSLHQKNDILQIVHRNCNCIDSSFIEKYKLTCVVENDLFRTVYVNGQRVMWNLQKGV